MRADRDHISRLQPQIHRHRIHRRANRLRLGRLRLHNVVRRRPLSMRTQLVDMRQHHERHSRQPIRLLPPDRPELFEQVAIGLPCRRQRRNDQQHDVTLGQFLPHQFDRLRPQIDIRIARRVDNHRRRQPRGVRHQPRMSGRPIRRRQHIRRRPGSFLQIGKQRIDQTRFPRLDLTTHQHAQRLNGGSRLRRGRSTCHATGRATPHTTTRFTQIQRQPARIEFDGIKPRLLNQESQQPLLQFNRRSLNQFALHEVARLTRQSHHRVDQKRPHPHQPG